MRYVSGDDGRIVNSGDRRGATPVYTQQALDVLMMHGGGPLRVSDVHESARALGYEGSAFDATVAAAAQAGYLNRVSRGVYEVNFADPVRDAEASDDGEGGDDGLALPAHLRATLDALEACGGEKVRSRRVAEVLGVSTVTASQRLWHLRKLGAVTAERSPFGGHINVYSVAYEDV